MPELTEAGHEEPENYALKQTKQQRSPPVEGAVAPAEDVHTEIDQWEEDRHEHTGSDGLTILEQLLHRFLTLPDELNFASDVASLPRFQPVASPVGGLK